MLKAFAGGRLFGARYGTAPPKVLALHGWQRSHLDFEAVLQARDPQGRALDAVALDLPGFGATPPPETAWGSAQYAAALVPVLEEIGHPVVVLGHSFGGRIALHLASAEPSRVRALVLTGVPQITSSEQRARPNVRYRAIRSLARAHLLSPGRLERARDRYGSADYRAASGVIREVLVKVLAERYEQMLPGLAMPAELVWGERDTAAPPALAARAAMLLPDARLTVLEGVGHLVPIECPNALRDALERLGC